EYGWNQNLEAEFTYERYLNDFFRLFGGVNAENELEDNLDEISTTAVAGVRYLLPLLIDADFRIDNKLRPQIGLATSTMLFPRIGIFAEYEYQMDFGWVNDLPDLENGRDRHFMSETSWQVGLEYVLGRNFALVASYDNRFGAGAGLSVLF
ncbi:MAG: copper oxidase, partial [Saprospiraceae bacterium]|nr:copper oxidase [Saprospiraceae bacterium]